MFVSGVWFFIALFHFLSYYLRHNAYIIDLFFFICFYINNDCYQKKKLCPIKVRK